MLILDYVRVVGGPRPLAGEAGEGVRSQPSARQWFVGIPDDDLAAGLAECWCCLPGHYGSVLASVNS